MEFIKRYDQFINEGAWVDPTDSSKVLISNVNTSANNDEVLKTTDTSSGIDTTMVPFPVYWGLTYKEYTGTIDHEGRFKYTMDRLKKAKSGDTPIIYDMDGNSGETALAKFVKSNFQQLKIFSPDYICAIGSTEGLSGMLGRAINMVYTDAMLINLNKVSYKNAVEAFNFVEFKKQVEQQLAKKPTSKTFPSTKKYLINSYIDDLLTDPQVMAEIDGTENPDELEKVLLSNINKLQFKERDADGKTLIPFIVRSTKRGFGGTRAFWKSKYDYQEEQFLNAVQDCIKNDRKMIIVDDNKNSGKDIKSISESITNIAKAIMKVELDLTKNIRIQDNFAFYMMYDMHHEAANYRIRDKKPHHDSHGHKINAVKLSDAVLKNFEDYLKTPSEKKEEFIRQNRKFANATQTEMAEKAARENLIFSKVKSQFDFLLELNTRRRREINYTYLLRSAWENVMSRDEYSNDNPRVLAKIFIKIAKKNKWPFLKSFDLEKLQELLSLEEE